MRIECDKCAAKYSIADEKVRGKTFKIRCKKCSNVIIVRDKAAAAGEPDAATSEPAPSEEPPGWHLAIDGDTVGPLPADEVRRRYDAGQIDKSTSVWQEGFEDWLELGKIEAFADLPDREPAAAAAGIGGGIAAAAAADDPFASSGSDDAFAAGSGEFGGGGGFGSEPEPAPAPAPAPAAAAAAMDESPRIDSLTGQRNENSVLFSLDSLKAMASTSKPASAGPVRQAPSTTAPASEGSGLIDIRAMGAMMDGPSPDAGLGGGGGGGGGSADDEMLPSFGGGGLGGLSVEPLVTEPPPSVAPAPVEQRRSNAPMYILIGLLAAGLIGLGVMILLKEPEEPQVIKEVVTVPGSVEEKKDDDKDKDKDKDKDEDEDDTDEDAAGETEGETEGDAASTGGKPSGKKKKKAGGSGGSSGLAGGSSGGSGGSSGGSGGGSGGSGGTKEKEPDVDCLLDPGLAKCKGGGGGGGGGGSKAAPDPSLPKKLGAAEIKSGIDGVKPATKSCGSGTTVAIKFSVKGSTGSVSSAKALDEHASSSVGKCVAAAAKNAKFPKFQADQQGFTFKFRL